MIGRFAHVHVLNSGFSKPGILTEVISGTHKITLRSYVLLLFRRIGNILMPRSGEMQGEGWIPCWEQNTMDENNDFPKRATGTSGSADALNGH